MINFHYYHGRGDGVDFFGYGGCYRCGYMAGIFYDEDMMTKHEATGSTILTL